jgi:hypothetical protein
MKNKLALVLYCLFVGMLGLVTRLLTDDFNTVNMVRFVVANLFIIGGIYYWCNQMFVHDLKHQFSVRPFIKKGLLVGGLIGFFTGISVALQIFIFGNEVLLGNLQIINIDPQIKAENLQEAIDGAYISYSWWALSGMQVLKTLFWGAFYSIIIAALFRFHPDRVRS